MVASPATQLLGTPPISRTRLIGREAEIATARSLLLDDAVPLLTLTGPGGVGKTRLALAVAQDVALSFADGVVWVDLSPVTDPRLIPTTVAAALALPEAADLRLMEIIARALQARQMLLLLDNCEHLLEAVARGAAELLTACPTLQILAASRAPLRLREEHEQRVDPLPLPDRDPAEPLAWAQVAAVALFVERAQAVDRTFALSSRTAPVIADICRRVDGLPLAIELAAARTKLLSPAALLAQMTDRLRVLGDGPRNAPARQRTMRAAISWSYHLLSADEQTLFRRLAVFAGGFSLAAASDVARASPVISADPVAVLSSLLDMSLVRRLSDVGNEPRYGLLETVRAYGLERLVAAGEEAPMREAQARHFLRLTEEAKPAFFGGPAQESWAVRLAAEQHNLAAAMTWSLAHDPPVALRLAIAASSLWYVSGPFAQGRQWIDQALAALPTAEPRLRADALSAASGLAQRQRDGPAAEALAVEAMRLWEALGDRGELANARFLQAIAVEIQGDLPRAISLLQEALTQFRAVGDAAWEAYALLNLGSLLSRVGDNPTAIAYLDAAQRIEDRIDDAWGAALLHDTRAELAEGRGDWKVALGPLGEALSIWQVQGDWSGITDALFRIATAAIRLGHAPQAARLFGAGMRMRTQTGAGVFAALPQRVQEGMAAAEAALGRETFAAEFAVGEAWSFGQSVSEALEVITSTQAPAADTDAAPPSAAEALGLSPRELEVLQSIVAGYSNAEIAQQLFISCRTVTTHISHLYAKLGVTTRAQAIAAAHRLELL